MICIPVCVRPRTVFIYASGFARPPKEPTLRVLEIRFAPCGGNKVQGSNSKRSEAFQNLLAAICDIRHLLSLRQYRGQKAHSLTAYCENLFFVFKVIVNYELYVSAFNGLAGLYILANAAFANRPVISTRMVFVSSCTRVSDLSISLSMLRFFLGMRSRAIPSSRYPRSLSSSCIPKHWSILFSDAGRHSSECVLTTYDEP
jgi:hypothetical protein